MTYHTFIQYNNGLLQDFIDKFKPRTAISSTSKYQNKYIFRQTSPKRPSQAKENPNEKNSQYNQLSTKTNKHSLWCSHPYTYMMPYILLYILYPARTNRFTRKAHPKNTVHQQRSIRHENTAHLRKGKTASSYSKHC